MSLKETGSAPTSRDKKIIGLIGCLIIAVPLIGLVICAGGFAAWSLLFYQPQSPAGLARATSRFQPTVTLPTPTVALLPTNTPQPTDTPVPTSTPAPTTPPTPTPIALGDPQLITVAEVTNIPVYPGAQAAEPIRAAMGGGELKDTIAAYMTLDAADGVLAWQIKALADAEFVLEAGGEVGFDESGMARLQTTAPNGIQVLFTIGLDRDGSLGAQGATIIGIEVIPPVAEEQPTPEPPPPEPKSMHMSSPEYGMQAFLWWRPETADRDLKLIKEAGFGWVKQTFPWREIEGMGKGQFDWSRTDRIVDQVEQHGLDLIARIDSQPQWAGGGFPENGPPDNLQDFADFLSAVASRYRGRIRSYQVWNEPNLNVPGRSEWGGRPPNPAEYTEMLRVAYQAIKAADPYAIVISAGLSPTSRWDDVAMPDEIFLQGMYDAGAKPYFDALGAHGAGYKVSPETDPAVVAGDAVLHNNDPSPPERKRIYCFRHVEDLRQIMVANGDADKQVILLEFGWTRDPRPDSPYAWHAITEAEMADYLVRAYQYAKQNWAPWIGVMSLIYLCDPDWTEDREEFWWSITSPEGWPLEPYYALQNMPK